MQRGLLLCFWPKEYVNLGVSDRIHKKLQKDYSAAALWFTKAETDYGRKFCVLILQLDYNGIIFRNTLATQVLTVANQVVDTSNLIQSHFSWALL